jgi:hypothetical protein
MTIAHNVKPEDLPTYTRAFVVLCTRHQDRLIEIARMTPANTTLAVAKYDSVSKHMVLELVELQAGFNDSSGAISAFLSLCECGDLIPESTQTAETLRKDGVDHICVCFQLMDEQDPEGVDCGVMFFQVDRLSGALLPINAPGGQA